MARPWEMFTHCPTCNHKTVEAVEICTQCGFSFTKGDVYKRIMRLETLVEKMAIKLGIEIEDSNNV